MTISASLCSSSTSLTSQDLTPGGCFEQAPAPATCRFIPLHYPSYSEDVAAVYKNDSLVECTTPNMTQFFTNHEMMVETVLEVSLNGDQFTTLNQIVFTFYKEPTIRTANQGSSGTNLVVNGGDPVSYTRAHFNVSAHLLRWDRVSSRSERRCVSR
eukprot:2550118-Rhodomonas_salina.4